MILIGNLGTFSNCALCKCRQYRWKCRFRFIQWCIKWLCFVKSWPWFIGWLSGWFHAFMKLIWGQKLGVIIWMSQLWLAIHKINGWWSRFVQWCDWCDNSIRRIGFGQYWQWTHVGRKLGYWKFILSLYLVFLCSSFSFGFLSWSICLFSWYFCPSCCFNAL